MDNGQQNIIIYKTTDGKALFGEDSDSNRNGEDEV